MRIFHSMTREQKGFTLVGLTLCLLIIFVMALSISQTASASQITQDTLTADQITSAGIQNTTLTKDLTTTIASTATWEMDKAAADQKILIGTLETLLTNPAISSDTAAILTEILTGYTSPPFSFQAKTDLDIGVALGAVPFYITSGAYDADDGRAPFIYVEMTDQTGAAPPRISAMLQDNYIGPMANDEMIILDMTALTTHGGFCLACIEPTASSESSLDTAMIDTGDSDVGGAIPSRDIVFTDEKGIYAEIITAGAQVTLRAG